MIYLNSVAAFIGLIIGSVADIKTREIPDWLNFSLIGFGLGNSLLVSILFNNYHIVGFSILGFLVGLVIAYLLYRCGQWGGGDAKMLMGLGALLGFNFTNGVPDLMVLIMNIFVFGALYGIFWSVYLSIKHREEFKEALKKRLHNTKTMNLRKILWIFILVGVITSFAFNTQVQLLILAFLAIVFIMFYFFIYTKTVEEACMEKKISIDKLTEGDWVLEKVVVKGKKICGPQYSGITKEQIKELLKTKKQHKKKTIKVREGIPFLPSFLIAFIVMVLFGNWVIILF